MALTASAVADAKSVLSKMENMIDTYKDISEQLERILASNEDYQKFRTGTAYGQSFQDAIENIINLSKTTVFNEVTSLKSSTQEMLARQDELNASGK